MAMNWKWDLRRQHRIRLSRKNGIEITRGALVTSIPISGAFSSDPEVFCKVLADSGAPIIGLSTYPSSIYPFNLAILEELNPVNEPTMAVDQCRVEAIYRLTNPDKQNDALWTLTDSGQGSYIETNATVLGNKPIWVFYKKGYTGGGFGISAPSDDKGNRCWKTNVRGLHRFYPKRTIRVTAQMVAADWLLIKNALRAAAGSINETAWGSAARGTWLFLFPTSSTTDYGASFHVECNFLEDPDGFFPTGLYYDRHGEHPTDSATPSFLHTFGTGVPPFNNLLQANGIVRASVYPETEFNTLFTFTPDD